MGFFMSIPFSDLLLRSGSSNMVLEADNHFLLSVLGAILVVIVILLFAFRCTKLVKKSSPIDAIRSGQTGERYKKKSPFRLVKSHGTPVSLWRSMMCSVHNHILFMHVVCACICQRLINHAKRYVYYNIRNAE